MQSKKLDCISIATQLTHGLSNVELIMLFCTCVLSVYVCYLHFLLLSVDVHYSVSKDRNIELCGF